MSREEFLEILRSTKYSFTTFFTITNECLKQSSGTKHHRAGVLVKD
jgi:hypothetical protein